MSGVPGWWLLLAAAAAAGFGAVLRVVVDGAVTTLVVKRRAGRGAVGHVASPSGSIADDRAKEPSNAPTAVGMSRFPWGLLVVNLSGALLIGLLLGATHELLANGPANAGMSALPGGSPEPGSVRIAWLVGIGTGLLGGYTTFSTASSDTVRLLRERRWAAALWNGPGMLVAAVLLALFGAVLGAAIAG